MNCSKYSLTAKDKKEITESGIQKYIFSKLSSKRFRKWKMTDTCVDRVNKAISIAINENKPLQVIFFQGGYKLWRLPSTPEADWAEFFNIAYLIEYIAPVVEAYKPGVNLTYYMHTLLMEMHDNLTTKEIKAYVDSFQNLLDEFQKYLPKNLTIKILKDADIYTRDEYFQRLEEGVEIAKKQYQDLSLEKKDKYHKLGALNIKWQGKEDWSKLSDKEKDQKIHKGVLYEMSATANLPKVMATVKSDDKICLFTNPAPIFIAVGSTKNSVTKYWTGFGVLEYYDNKFHDRVLSPSQFINLKSKKHSISKINLIDLKNLENIWIYEQRFNFAKK